MHPEGSNTSLEQHNRSHNDNEANSPRNSRRETFERIEQSTHGNNPMMKSIRKELDEIKNAMKGKMAMNLDGMIKRIDSPFTANVLECPLPSKFRLPQLEVNDSTKDSLDHIGAFKTILNL